jgi:hypothetical protein
VLLAIYYHNNGNNEEGTGGDCNARNLMENKYKIFVGNGRKATLIGSCRFMLENSTTWVISSVLHTVYFSLKNEFILQNTFTGLQSNLDCALSQRSNVSASLVFLSGRLRC